LASFLSDHPKVDWVRYPHHPSHPQHDLALRQMSNGGTVVTFSVAAGGISKKEAAFRLMDRLRVVDISNNFGDTKSLIAHPATTTHRAMGAEARDAIGLEDSVVRLSVGLEHPEDLIADLDFALD
jgi:O-succinylhomoserine sulfhydrylase